MLLLSKPLWAHGASCRLCAQELTTYPQVANLVVTTLEASANEASRRLGQIAEVRKCRSNRFCDATGVNGRVMTRKRPELNPRASEWVIGGAYV